MATMKAGTHVARVAKHAISKSSKGVPSVYVIFENDGGSRIMWYGYLSPRALKYTLKTLAILGWDPAAHDGDIGTLNGTDLLVGAEAELVVEDETYEGKTTAQVKWVNELGAQRPLEPAEVARIAASVRDAILAASQPATPPDASPPGDAGDGFDDDLPF